MIGLFVGGHCLITGSAGYRQKRCWSGPWRRPLGLIFKRIQFTPDLMPSDITGTDIIEEDPTSADLMPSDITGTDIIEEDPTSGRRTWTFVQGPIFANILLADEVNRTPPKTQSALLETMQEKACTVRGNNYTLPAPSSYWQPRTPSNWKAPTPFPKRSSTASCSTPSSITSRPKKNSRWWT
ncbi:MAG: AAA family ATPase [Ignavibacteriota bacterium]